MSIDIRRIIGESVCVIYIQMQNMTVFVTVSQVTTYHRNLSKFGLKCSKAKVIWH